MNSIELFHQSGKSAGVFACGVCRLVKADQAEAEKCCSPKACERCGATVEEKYWTVCEACREKKEQERQLEQFEAAQKVPEAEYEGWVYTDRTGYQDGYFASVAELRDYLEGDAEVEMPAYVWACTPNHFVQVDMIDIMDRLYDEAWEDFDEGCLEGVPALKVALAAFNETNAGVCSYNVDHTRAVLLG